MCLSIVFLIAMASLLAMTLYYGAILAGWFKDPLMAHFRLYGEERRVYPLPRFLNFLGLSCLVLGIIPLGPLLSLSLMALGLLALGAGWFIGYSWQWRAVLPRWYHHLLEETTREERRALAYAWLRMPFRARLRLNGDQYAFRVWMDEIRLTVVYGARDPDDPWAAWQ